jgi:ABC-type transport system involved in multi-copper enzyme maturation permease subunit
MIALIASELTKLTTTRTPRWLLVGQAALVAMALSGAVASGSLSTAQLATDPGLRTLLEHGGVAAIISLALGITISAGEYRHGTIVDSLLTEPRRVRLVVGKLAAGLLIGLLVGVVIAGVTVGVSAAWYAVKDLPAGTGPATVLRSTAGIVLWQTLYLTLGVGLGAAVRAQAAAIVAAVAWLSVAEVAVAQLLTPVGRWLPATAARALGYDPDPALLSQVGGGLVLAVWTVLAGVAAVAVTLRRDVT